MGHSLRAELGDVVRLSLLLRDGQASLYPDVTVYDDTNAVALPATALTHVGLGYYVASWVPTSSGTYSAVYRVFEDAPRTIPADYERSMDQISIDVPPDEVMLGAVYDNVADELRLEAWVLRRGQSVLAVTSASISIYDADDNLMYTVTDLAPDGQGVFRIIKPAPGLIEDRLYVCAINITMPTHSVSGKKGFKVIT